MNLTKAFTGTVKAKSFGSNYIHAQSYKSVLSTFNYYTVENADLMKLVGVLTALSGSEATL